MKKIYAMGSRLSLGSSYRYARYYIQSSYVCMGVCLYAFDTIYDMRYVYGMMAYIYYTNMYDYCMRHIDRQYVYSVSMCDCGGLVDITVDERVYTCSIYTVVLVDKESSSGIEAYHFRFTDVCGLTVYACIIVHAEDKTHDGAFDTTINNKQLLLDIITGNHHNKDTRITHDDRGTEKY